MKSINQAFIIFTILMTSCGGNAVASSSAGSSTSTINSSSDSPSIINPAMRVTDMMQQLTPENYSFTFLQNNEVTYAIDVDYPLIKAEVDLSDFGEFFPEILKIYFDFTNEDSPLMYRPSDQDPEAWIVESALSVQISLILSPLSFLEMDAFEDDWFTYDTDSGTYTLSLNYVDEVFGSTDTEGIQGFTVHGDENHIHIRIEGYNPENNEPLTIELRYESIGTTFVTLPTNIVDPSLDFFNVLATSTNHAYSFKFVENPDTDYEVYRRIQDGARDGNSFTYSIFEEQQQFYQELYFAPTDSGYEKITLEGMNPLVETIDETSYLQGLAAFYPLNFLEIQYEWLTPDTQPIQSGNRVFNLSPDYYSQVVSTDLLPASSQIDSVSLSITAAFDSYYLQVKVLATFEATTYELSIDVYDFNNVFIERPFIPDPDLSLHEILALLQEANNYALFQSSYDINEGFFNTIYHFDARVEGNRFQLYEPPTYPIYVMEEGSYQRYYLDSESGEALKEPITQTAFEEAVIDPQWLDFSQLNPSMVILDESNPQQGELLLEGYPNFVNIDWEMILEDYQFSPIPETIQASIESIHFMTSSGFQGQTLTVEILATVETLHLQMVAIYSEIGEIMVEVYEVATPLTAEAFINTYPDGLLNYLGTLTIYENEEYVDEYYFGRDNQTIVIVDFYSFTYQAYLMQTSENYVRIEGTPGELDTDVYPSTFAAFQEALIEITYVDFAELTTAMLTEDPYQVGRYYLDPSAYASIMNLPLTNQETIVEVSFELNLESVVVIAETLTPEQISRTYELQYDSINENLAILDIIQNVH